MKIIVCVDKNNGMAFMGKRQSMDCVLRERVLEITNGARLLMNSFSAKQFENTNGITVDDAFLQNAGQGDFCFVENIPVPAHGVEEFYIFNWNRKYPADLFFDIDLKAKGFKRVKKEDFKGNSHDKITLEIYSE